MSGVPTGGVPARGDFAGGATLAARGWPTSVESRPTGASFGTGASFTVASSNTEIAEAGLGATGADFQGPSMGFESTASTSTGLASGSVIAFGSIGAEYRAEFGSSTARMNLTGLIPRRLKMAGGPMLSGVVHVRPESGQLGPDK